MENTKKPYETPVVTKVEFDARDRITASICLGPSRFADDGMPDCRD